MPIYKPTAEKPVLVGVQLIQPDGVKRFLKGTAKEGNYHPIGRRNDGNIFIGEGYATCARVHEATGDLVYVAFDSGNLKSVAINIRKKFPDARLILLADNDRFTTKPVDNPGLTFARIAAEAVNAIVAVPTFPDKEFDATDFDDLYRLSGIDAVRKTIVNAINPPVVAPSQTSAAMVPIGSSDEDVFGPDSGRRFFDPTLSSLPAPTLETKPSPEPWSTPVDLWGRFAPPGLPSELLPPLLEKYAQVQSDMMGADAGGIAAAALAICGAAISDGIQLQVKRHDPSWTESARIWVVAVGMPSTKKSPIISAASRPLAKLDHALARKYHQDFAAWCALSKEEQKQTPRPLQRRLRIEDTTIEAAQEVLRDSPDGVLCLQDELSGFFGSMDKYSGNKGAAKDRSFWLQSFNGGPYAVNRISRGSLIVDNLSISLLGGIQPEAIKCIAADSVDDGLLQRIFPIVLRPASLGKDEPMPDIAVAYSDLISRLHNLTAEDVGNYGPGATGPGRLHFDDGAQSIRADLERRHLDLQSIESVNPKLAAHIGKYDGLFARLCVIWHCIEHASDVMVPDTVSDETAANVARFLHEFLLPHALSFFAGVLGFSSEQDRLGAVGGHILAHRLKEVSFRDIQRGDRVMRAMDRREQQKVLEQLESLGWIREADGPRPSSSRWIVNPLCHEMFADQGHAEHERRTKAREMIAEIASQAA